jgi:hypothetical protein
MLYLSVLWRQPQAASRVPLFQTVEIVLQWSLTTGTQANSERFAIMPERENSPPESLRSTVCYCMQRLTGRSWVLLRKLTVVLDTAYFRKTPVDGYFPDSGLVQSQPLYITSSKSIQIYPPIYAMYRMSSQCEEKPLTSSK